MRTLHVRAALLLPILALGCATAPAREVADSMTEPGAITLPNLTGPRRSVAVARFDAIDAFTAAHGGWDVGGGLAAMLTSALVETGRFVVLERPELDHVLSEQRLKTSGVVKAETGPGVGAVTGAQFLILGNVTEFGEEESGEGFGLGVGGLLGGRGNSSVGARSTKGHVSMDIRVVDSTTGEVVASFHVQEKIGSQGLSGSLGIDAVSFGGESFQKTPLGAAARRAIDQAVARFASSAASRPWQGRVVTAEGMEAAINAGSEDGVQVGDEFAVNRVLEKLTDPETGVALGDKRQALGRLRVSRVEARVAYATWIPCAVAELSRGDLVTSL